MDEQHDLEMPCFTEQWMLAQPRSSQGTDAPGLLSPNQIAQHTDDTLQRNGTNVIKEAANATGARLLDRNALSTS